MHHVCLRCYHDCLEKEDIGWISGTLRVQEIKPKAFVGFINFIYTWAKAFRAPIRQDPWIGTQPLSSTNSLPACRSHPECLRIAAACQPHIGHTVVSPSLSHHLQGDPNTFPVLDFPQKCVFCTVHPSPGQSRYIRSIVPLRGSIYNSLLPQMELPTHSSQHWITSD